MKVINFFAGPGSGKSTCAAGVFTAMKHRDIKCELVTEYAKDMTYENRHLTLSDQLYMLAKQNQRLKRLEGKVDYAITDSPLIMGLVYQVEGYYENFAPLVKEIFNSYDNVNFFIERLKKYQTYGRNQTEEQAKGKDLEIIHLLAKYSIESKRVKGDIEAPSKVLGWMGIH
jgi:hypothetical protein